MRSLGWICLTLGIFGRLSAWAISGDTDFQGAAGRVSDSGGSGEAQWVKIEPVAAGSQKGWWCLRLTGLEKETPVQLRFQRDPTRTPWDRAAFSVDGKTWRLTREGTGEKDTMVYQLPPCGTSVLVAREPPYTLGRAAEEIHRLAQQHEWAEELELGGGATSGSGRPLLRVAEGDRVAARRFGIWIQGQQKPCDMASSWVCQGVMNWVAGDSTEAQWLRQNAEIHCIPVMHDGTAAPVGLGAVSGMFADLAADERLDVFIDVQSVTGKDAKLELRWPAAKSASTRSGIAEFCALLEKELPGLAHAEGRIEHPTNEGTVTPEWVKSHGNEATIALTLCLPAQSPTNTLEGYDAIGAGVARAMERYCEARSRAEGR